MLSSDPTLDCRLLITSVIGGHDQGWLPVVTIPTSQRASALYRSTLNAIALRRLRLAHVLLSQADSGCWMPKVTCQVVTRVTKISARKGQTARFALCPLCSLWLKIWFYRRKRSPSACFMTAPPTSEIALVSGISLGQTSTQFCA